MEEKWTILRRLLDDSKAELKRASIDDIVAQFQPVLDEFYALTESLRAAQPDYNRVFMRFVQALQDEYPTLTINLMFVRPSNYSTDLWGPVYWRFLHLASILVSYAFEHQRIRDMLDLPTLVYNIDLILPCPMCAAHYQAIKQDSRVLLAVKNMSFGSIVTYLQTFHNIVTENVDRTPEYANRPPRPPFTSIRFARVYGCLEIQPSDLLKSKTYTRCRIEWLPKLHRLLATLLALYRPNARFLECSDELKANYDDNHDDRTALTNDLYSAITLDIDEKRAYANLEDFNETVLEFYTSYPDVVRSLANLLPDDDDDRKGKIFRLLEKFDNKETTSQK